MSGAALMASLAMAARPQYRVRWKVSPKQGEFLRLRTRFSLFVGGRGSGKTVAGTLKGIEEAGRRPCAGVVVSPTYGNLEDVNIPEFLARADAVVADHNKSRHIVTLINGSTVYFRSADKPNFMRGLSVHWAWIDEGAMQDVYVWRVALPAVRQFGVVGPMWVTTTPRGKNWLWEKFAPKDDETPDRAQYRSARYGMVRAHTRDNVFLAPEIIADLEFDYGLGAFARQELAGEFVEPEGTLFKREWLPIIDAPKLPIMRWCRGWDLACSTSKSADYTAGVRVGVDAAQNYYITHVVRERREWPDAELLIAATCALDGRGSRHAVEKVGFQTAAVQGLLRRADMAGYVLDGRNVDRDKLSRAMPIAARAKAGKVFVLRGAWNSAFLDEVCDFTGNDKDCPHDDQVDGMSMAYHALSGAEVWLRV